jgi:hypothetical protein
MMAPLCGSLHERGFCVSTRGDPAMTHFMRRVGLTVAVLGLVIGAAGQARADLTVTYTGSFTGLSDQAGYSVQPGGPFTPLPPTLFTAGFTYTDDGTSTSLRVYVNGPAILGPDEFNSDTVSEPDSAIASGFGLLPQFFTWTKTTTYLSIPHFPMPQVSRTGLS